MEGFAVTAKLLKISTEYCLPLDSTSKILYLSVMKTTTTKTTPPAALPATLNDLLKAANATFVAATPEDKEKMVDDFLDMFEDEDGPDW